MANLKLLSERGVQKEREGKVCEGRGEGKREEKIGYDLYFKQYLHVTAYVLTLLRTLYVLSF